MKVLHLSLFDDIGGAARSALRLNNALNISSGVVDSRMIVLKKISTSKTVSEFNRTFFTKVVADIQRRYFAIKFFNFKTKNPVIHSGGMVSSRMVDYLNNCSADIIHLHWICGMLSIKDIGRIKKPLVWTFHDMWPFCGAEHLSMDDRYVYGYGGAIRAPHESGSNINNYVWKKKIEYWSGKKINIVTPSIWLGTCAKESVLFKNSSVSVIPNPIDCSNTWISHPLKLSREKLNLPNSQTRLLLFGADGGIQNSIKGVDLLFQALQHLSSKVASFNYEIMIVGQESPSHEYKWPFKVHWMGRISDEKKMSMIYSAADLVMISSRIENFPNMALEAISCGTPVVAFKAGGLTDLIAHHVNGYLATPYCPKDFARGIEWLIHSGIKKLMSKPTNQNYVSKNFGYETVAKKYTDLYKKILE